MAHQDVIRAPEKTASTQTLLLQSYYKKNCHFPLIMLHSRLNGIQEVSGSIPLISTKKKDREVLKNQGFPVFFCFFRLYSPDR